MSSPTAAPSTTPGVHVVIVTHNDTSWIENSYSTGKLSVFVGKSGVGKTTLLNTIQPDLGLRVNEVSQATNFVVDSRSKIVYTGRRN